MWTISTDLPPSVIVCLSAEQRLGRVNVGQRPARHFGAGQDAVAVGIVHIELRREIARRFGALDAAVAVRVHRGGIALF
jgi:hypothetical protein